MVRVLMYRDVMGVLIDAYGNFSSVKSEDIVAGDKGIMTTPCGVERSVQRVWVPGEYAGETVDQICVVLDGQKVWLDRSHVNTHGRIRVDEKFLLGMCKQFRQPGKIAEHLDFITSRLNMHPMRAFRVLEKWERKGWWECGVGTWHGWMTQKGMEASL